MEYPLSPATLSGCCNVPEDFSLWNGMWESGLIFWQLVGVFLVVAKSRRRGKYLRTKGFMTGKDPATMLMWSSPKHHIFVVNILSREIVSLGDFFITVFDFARLSWKGRWFVHVISWSPRIPGVVVIRAMLMTQTLSGISKLICEKGVWEMHTESQPSRVRLRLSSVSKGAEAWATVDYDN